MADWWKRGGMFDGDKSVDELIEFLSSHKIEIYHQAARALRRLSDDVNKPTPWWNSPSPWETR